MKRFIIALTFLTRLYIPNHYEMDDRDFAGSTWFYPVIGLIIGAIMAGIYYGASFLTKEKPLLALILILGYVFLSGGLHLDGLADSFDGLFSGRDREKIFVIMQDSRMGSFGVIGLILYFVTLFVLFQYVDWRILLLFPLVGRSSVLIAAGISKYAKEKGLGKVIVEGTGKGHILYALLISFAIGALMSLKLLIPISICFITVYCITKRISHRLSGITGDIMGMMIELSQCIFLFAAILLL